MIEKFALVTAVASALDLSVIVAAPVAPEGFLIPRMFTVTGAPVPTEQVPPLSASVIVTVFEALVAVTEQLLTLAPPIVTVGAAGTKRPAAAPRVAVIVSPAARAPDALGVN